MSSKKPETKLPAEKPLLSDEGKYPDEIVLKEALGESLKVYDKLIGSVVKPEYGLNPEWHYYKDGKSWLCKVMHKKKTVFWLSVWKGRFKISFYFTEKHIADISALNINTSIIQGFLAGKTIGNLIPVVVDMYDETYLADVQKIIDYKIKAK
jgi:hypothetical protein